jgi:hypothetical protein
MTGAEIILEARRKKAAGEFKRKIVARYPDDLHFDLVDLDCGHHLLVAAALVVSVERVLDCHECMKEWVKSHAESGS